MRWFVLVLMCVTWHIGVTQECNMVDSKSLSVDLSTGNIIVDITTAYPCPTKGIYYFNGPCGTNNCTVQQGQDFSLFWGVQDVSSCTASNDAGNASFNGAVEPFSPGSGEFQKNIVNNLPLGITTFTLDCPIIVTKKYSFEFLAKTVKEVVLRDDKRMVFMNNGLATLIMNLNFNSYKSKSITKAAMNKQLGDNVFYSDVNLHSVKDLNLSVKWSEEDKLPKDMRIWFYISKEDPNVNPQIGPLKEGRCDMLGIKKNAYILTSSYQDDDTLPDACHLNSDETYYLTTVFLKEIND